MMISKRNILLVTFGLVAFSISSYAIWSVWNGNNLTVQEMRTEMRKEIDRYKTFNGISRLSIARMNEVKVDIAYGLGVNKEAAIKSVDIMNDKIPDNYTPCPNKPDKNTVTNLFNEKINFYDHLYASDALNITELIEEYGKDVKRAQEHFESMAGDCKPNIFYFNCILQLNELFREEIGSFVFSRDTVSEMIHGLNDQLKNALEISLQHKLGLLDDMKDKINKYVCCVKNLKIYVDTQDLDCVEPFKYTPSN